MSHAIIVLGHGSRSAEATAQFMEVVEMLRARRTDATVLPAFMELAEPSLPGAVEQVVEGGARDVLILPCFLFQGNHIKRDIPGLLAEIGVRHPGVRIHMHRHIGPDPRLVDILCDRAEERYCLN